MPVGQLGTAALCLLVGKHGRGGESFEEVPEARMGDPERAEALEQVLGWPVPEPDHVAFDLAAQTGRGRAPAAGHAVAQIPQSAQLCEEAVWLGEAPTSGTSSPAVPFPSRRTGQRPFTPRLSKPSGGMGVGGMGRNRWETASSAGTAERASSSSTVPFAYPRGYFLQGSASPGLPPLPTRSGMNVSRYPASRLILRGPVVMARRTQGARTINAFLDHRGGGNVLQGRKERLSLNHCGASWSIPYLPCRGCIRSATAARSGPEIQGDTAGVSVPQQRLPLWLCSARSRALVSPPQTTSATSTLTGKSIRMSR